MKKTALITGITGQDGAYLSELLLKKEYKVFGFVRDKDDYLKLEYLKIKDKIIFVKVDLLNLEEVRSNIQRIKPNEVYNFAAQSSVGVSYQKTFQTISFNFNSTLNLLETIRIVNPKMKMFQPSSSEMYGEQQKLPIDENSKFNSLMINPYALSKIIAHQICEQYRHVYKLNVFIGILFNHESILRGSNFFIKKIITQAFEIKEGKRDVLLVGDLSTKRDFGYAPEYVKAMWLMLQQEKADNFIIASGRSVLLQDIVYYIFGKLKIPVDKIKVDKKLFRPIEVKDSYGDASKAKEVLGWSYDLNFYQVLDSIIEKRNLYEIARDNKKYE